MLWTAAMMKGYAVSGTDGRLGTVSDLLFDDVSWRMRWLVVSTGDWFPNHDVLLPVSALGHLDPVQRRFRVALTVQQIRDSPRVEGDLPVSRQEEVGSPLRRAAAGVRTGHGILSVSRPSDPHLRSMEAVLGHLVHAIDGLIGHIDDFLIDDAAWNMRFIKIDTRDWGPARRVLLSPRLILKSRLAGARGSPPRRSPGDRAGRSTVQPPELTRQMASCFLPARTSDEPGSDLSREEATRCKRRSWRAISGSSGRMISRRRMMVREY